MSLFLQSQKSVSAACQEIADAAGASADSDMCTRAWRSLNAAIQYFDGKAFWNFALTEPGPIAVKGVWATAISASAASAVASCAANHYLSANDFIYGSPFTQGTRITATGTTAIYLNCTVTALTGTQTTGVTVYFGRDMYACPTDYKRMHSARMLGSQRTLRPLQRRMYDRSTVDEFAINNTPLYYDIYPVGQRGVIRFLPPPNVDDVFQWRYFRYMATASTSATADLLDIPSQYEGYLIAQAKFFFLTDKSEQRSQQAETWMSFAQEGLKIMLRDNVSQPDEDLMMIPGHFAFSLGYGPTNTKAVLDDPW